MPGRSKLTRLKQTSKSPPQKTNSPCKQSKTNQNVVKTVNEQIPVNLGLIDGMSKFFTTNSTQRPHHLPQYMSIQQMVNNNQMMARKILKRTRNHQRSKQSAAVAVAVSVNSINSALSLNNNSIIDNQSNLLNSSDKENQQTMNKRLSSNKLALKSNVNKKMKSPNAIVNKKNSLLLKIQSNKRRQLKKQPQTNSKTSDNRNSCRNSGIKIRTVYILSKIIYQPIENLKYFFQYNSF